MDFFNRLNANERLAAIGAVIVIISSLIGLVTSFGLGASIIALLAAIAVLIIYYLKYSPTQNINWPAPVPLLVLGISGVAALLALLGLLPLLGLLGFFGLAVLAAIGTLVGTVVMVWGAWQEYQTMPKATAPATGNQPVAPASSNEPVATTTPPTTSNDPPAPPTT